MALDAFNCVNEGKGKEKENSAFADEVVITSGTVL
jgi:hypothetical protein